MNKHTLYTPLAVLLALTLLPACGELEQNSPDLRTLDEALRRAPSFEATASTTTPRTASAAFRQAIGQRGTFELTDIQPYLHNDAEVAFAIEYGNGQAIGVNVLLDEFGVETAASARRLSIHRASVDNFRSSNLLDGLDELDRGDAYSYLDAPIGESRPFCDNEDGTPAHTLLATAQATLDGVPAMVTLQINPNMTLAQLGLRSSGSRTQRTLSNSGDTQNAPSFGTSPSKTDTTATTATRWVISWPASMCKTQKPENGGRRICPARECEVRLTDALLGRILREFDIEIPDFGDLVPLPYGTGTCGDVLILGLFRSCQCIIDDVRWDLPPVDAAARPRL